MFARLACFASLAGLMTVAAWAQEPSATAPATTTPAAPNAGPGLTLPGLPTASPTGTAAAPATSGSPEFDALLKKWDDLLDQMKQTQVDYKLAKPEERGQFVEKFKQLKLDGEKLQPEVLKAAEAGLAKDPKGTAFVTFLASFANGEYLRDNYEQALRISEKLIDAKYENKRIYNLAGKAAFNLCDFDKAEKYLKTAQEGSALDGRADGYLQNIEAYKTLWKKEQDLRAQEAKDAADPNKALPRVVLKTTDGDIVLELFENEAPQTVGNFVNLVEKGFYNGLAFHRVIHEFMAQGGDPNGDGSGGPGYYIQDETDKENRRLHFRGALSMAHSGVKNSGGSQFFITFCPTSNLDGKAVNPKNEQYPHTVFGRVVEGFDVLPKLQKRDTSSGPHGTSGPLPPADKIIEAKVLRKRNHPYEPTKLPEPKVISGK
jgi:cyclophilin family peptidyl-prolyl cis-trans isomerase